MLTFGNALKLRRGGVWIGGGDGDNPFSNATLISNRSGLEAIANDLTGHYILTADIDLSGGDWTPINGFAGLLDGAGHTISNMTVTAITSGGNEAGLFRSITAVGLVMRLGLENASVTNGTGDVYKGSLIGACSGCVADCYATGVVTTDGDRAGGLIGYIGSAGRILRCFAAVDMDGSIGSRTGGLCGFWDGAGAFNHFDSTIAGTTSTGNGGGGGNSAAHNTATMQTQATFSGWNFTAVWDMPVSSYPALRAGNA